MKHGGRRSNAGNKTGSIRPKLSHYWTDDDIKEYFEWLKTSYKENPVLAKMVGEQLMGKPSQEITGAEGGPIKITGVEIVVRK